jgi:hypothetical protein
VAEDAAPLLVRPEDDESISRKVKEKKEQALPLSSLSAGLLSLYARSHIRAGTMLPRFLFAAELFAFEVEALLLKVVPACAEFVTRSHGAQICLHNGGCGKREGRKCGLKMTSVVNVAWEHGLLHYFRFGSWNQLQPRFFTRNSHY